VKCAILAKKLLGYGKDTYIARQSKPEEEAIARLQIQKN
jgi:hypothetical protein